MLVAVVVAAAFGAIVALPTLRLRGLYLALATLAFAQGAVTIFFIPEVDTKGGLFIENLNFFGLVASVESRTRRSSTGCCSRSPRSSCSLSAEARSAGVSSGSRTRLRRARRSVST